MVGLYGSLNRTCSKSRADPQDVDHQQIFSFGLGPHWGFKLAPVKSGVGASNQLIVELGPTGTQLFTY